MFSIVSNMIVNTNFVSTAKLSRQLEKQIINFFSLYACNFTISFESF